MSADVRLVVAVAVGDEEQVRRGTDEDAVEADGNAQKERRCLP